MDKVEVLQEIKVLKTKASVKPDGTLSVSVPTGFSAGEVEVILQVKKVGEKMPSPESLGWPPGFIESTYGAWEGPPPDREQPTEYDKRIELP
jgi:hypothetical protein